MKQFLITIAGVFSALLLFFVGLPLLFVAIIASAAKPAPAPAHAVLTLDLREKLPDQSGSSPFAFLGARSTSVLSVVETLGRAVRDPAVGGLLIRLPEEGMPPAQADEIRIGLAAFRASGKPVIAHSQGIYPSGISTSTYMLGATSGDFWMQPESALQSTGVTSEDTFYKRFFDKYGIKADFQQRYEYKNAVNPYLQSDYTPAHREAELGWMTSVYQTELAQAAPDRHMTAPALQAVLEAGPYSAEDALARHLIDHVGQLEAAQDKLLSAAGADAKLVTFDQYRNTAKTMAASASSIAFIGAEGDIVTGTGANQRFGAASAVYSDDVSKAFYDAIHDDQIKAIVFRVSSPGGSDTASEQILSAVRAAVAAHKPVVVSMGTYAASGGYWISSQASEIIAEPSTLTGSIGVFGGKLVLGPALARFGIDLHDLTVGGDFASAYGSAQEFTPKQNAAISSWMDHIYANFVGRVASGRHLSVERVREIAKGRVWTGADAVKLGLVDKLGGLGLAVAEAKRLAGIPKDEHVTLRMLPSKASPFVAVQHMLGLSASSVNALAAVSWIATDPRAQGLLSEMARTEVQATGGGAVLARTLN
ncbi:MAG: signal peptide peptidase SppA [Caulobacteraceae bacterium]